MGCLTDERLAELIADLVEPIAMRGIGPGMAAGVVPRPIAARDLASALQELGRYRAVARKVLGAAASRSALADMARHQNLTWALDELCALVEGSHG